MYIKNIYVVYIIYSHDILNLTYVISYNLQEINYDRKK